MCRKERYIAFWRLTEKFVFLCFFISAFFLAACGDSDSGVGANEQQAEEEYDDSSSSKSVKSSSSTKSGSIAKSSSSKKSSSSTKNSSSSKTSSSSVSSSSEKSSSEGSERSSSSSFEQNLSSDTETDEDSLYKSLTCYRGAYLTDSTRVKCEKSFFENCETEKDMYASEETGKTFMCYKNEWIPHVDTYESDCDKEKEGGVIEYVSSSGYYGCRNGEWSYVDYHDRSYGFCWEGRLGDTAVDAGDTHYECKGTKWERVSVDDYLGKNCSDLEAIKSYEQREYKCRKSRWTQLTSLDSLFGLCIEDSLGVMKVKSDYYHYVCRDYEWIKATTEEVLGECTENRNFEMLKVYSEFYICDSNSWRSPNTLESVFGVCKPERSKEWDTYQNAYYECIGPEWKWTEISPDRIVGECVEEWQGMTFGGPYAYICDKETWRKFTDVEKKLKMACIEENEGAKKSYTLNSVTKTEYYQCKEGKWAKITEAEYLEE